MYGKRPGGSRRLGTNSVDPLQSIDFVETLLTVFDPKPQSAGEKNRSWKETSSTRNIQRELSGKLRDFFHDRRG
jgi:hypothetical protein